MKKGMTRAEAVNFFNSQKGGHIERKTVVNVLRNLKTSAGEMSCPDCVKVGDIYYHKGFHHYAIVLSVKKGNVVSVLVTSDQGTELAPDTRPYILGPTRSRFISSMFTYTTIMSTLEEVDKHFVGVYDNVTHLREVKRKLKKYYRRFINRV